MKFYEFRQMARRAKTGMLSLSPFGFLMLTACASTTPGPEAPTPRNPFAAIDSVVQIDFYETQWGIEVLDRTSNRIIVAHNPLRHFIPASNTKLVVTTVAM